ncbi:6-phosphogluconolactonase [Roseivirga sp. BDSF3-8]|uniref:6-phosphogluconolactonase n=1 Tax=Roseivirga sp. BDSF3-8 TaxID=3241598 RepID=UPI003531A814
MNTHIFSTQNDVAKALAEELANETAKKDKLYVALSGGSTPKVLFRLLSNLYQDRIDWSKIHFFWGDERCVPPDAEDSNFGMTKTLLFDKVEIPEANIHRVKGELSPEEANTDYIREIKEHVPVANGLPCFDLNILGMGEDGHTASIFPDQLTLLDQEGPTAIASHPKTGQKRVTLTGKVINNSRRVIFLVTGAGKAQRIKEISHSTGAGYPASYIKSAGGKAEWYLDEEAASLIK